MIKLLWFLMGVMEFHRLFTEKVDYDYNQYEAIGGMNLTIVMGSKA